MLLAHGAPPLPFRGPPSAKLLRVATEDDDEDIPGIERLLALTDGVVAIALTLLVLQLQVPAGTAVLTKHPDSALALWRALKPDGSELTSYLVSFLVIAQFWMVHHRVLRGMRGHSEGLAWRNFSFLLALTFFGLNLVAISLSTQWIFLYAAHHNLLMDVARSKLDERTARVRVLLVIIIVVVSILLAWTDPQLAKFVWLLFLVVSPVAERVSRRLEHSGSIPSLNAEVPSNAGKD